MRCILVSHPQDHGASQGRLLYTEWIAIAAAQEDQKETGLSLLRLNLVYITNMSEIKVKKQKKRPAWIDDCPVEFGKNPIRVATAAPASATSAASIQPSDCATLRPGKALLQATGSDIYAKKSASINNNSTFLAVFPGILSLRSNLNKEQDEENPSQELPSQLSQEETLPMTQESTIEDPVTQESLPSTTTAKTTNAASKSSTLSCLGTLDGSTLTLGNGLRFSTSLVQSKTKFLVLQVKKKKVICKHILSDVILLGNPELTEPKDEATTDATSNIVHSGASERCEKGYTAKENTQDTEAKTPFKLPTAKDDDTPPPSRSQPKRSGSKNKKYQTLYEDSSSEAEDDNSEGHGASLSQKVVLQQSDQKPRQKSSPKKEFESDDSASVIQLDDESDESFQGTPLSPASKQSRPSSTRRAAVNSRYAVSKASAESDEDDSDSEEDKAGRNGGRVSRESFSATENGTDDEVILVKSKRGPSSNQHPDEPPVKAIAKAKPGSRLAKAREKLEEQSSSNRIKNAAAKRSRSSEAPGLQELSQRTVDSSAVESNSSPPRSGKRRRKGSPMKKKMHTALSDMVEDDEFAFL